MKTKTYLTTAIPYVNAAPHVGFALELVQADALARLARRHAPARLQTGTDENAFKNVEAARAAGVPTREWVDRCAGQFARLSDDLTIGHDRFIRTTEPAHTAAVHALWRAFRAGDVYPRAYRGLYCSGCEDFLFEKDLVDGCCPDHLKPPVEVEETNCFFRLSAYQSAIERWIESGAVAIRPPARRNEILRFVRAGLQDISITRPAARSGGWGVPVPGDDSQVVYVWIDALVNYLSGLGFGAGENWREWWSDDVHKVHVIGRNVWKFHAVYWPALLLSAGLPLPDEIVIHGFLTADGRKIGKSLGNAIAPEEFIANYGADPVRYFLLRAVLPFDDGDFSPARFAAIYEADLANGLGNVVSRVVSLAVKAGVAERASELATIFDVAKFEAAVNERRSDEALAVLWAEIAAINADIERRKPWSELKRGDTDAVRVAAAEWLGRVGQVAVALEPFLPTTAARIIAALELRPLTPIAPLFPRR